MVIVGIVGGVASGKSLIAAQFERLGAVVIRADEIGHEVLLEEDVKNAIRQRWGPSVVDEKGEVDRAAVGRIVFAAPPAGPPELEFLEKLTHPRIGQRIRNIAASLADRTDVVVLDAALLIKAGWDRYCDKIVFVEANRDERLRRARRRGWSDRQFAAREAAQENLEEKRKRADCIIANSGSVEQTEAQVRQFWQTLV